MAYIYYLSRKPMLALAKLKEAMHYEQRYLRANPGSPFGMARLLLNEAVIRAEVQSREEGIRLCERAI